MAANRPAKGPVAKDGAHLPRLNLGLANLAMQQPTQALFSPALPTAIQGGFNPALQTPMQHHFAKGLPGPGFVPSHRAAQASLQLAAMGIIPPIPVMNVVSTPGPGQGHFPRHSIISGGVQGGFPMPQTPGTPGAGGPGGGPGGPPFPGRNRRALSIGGPPKAVLGGPQRNRSPNPATAGASGAANGAAAGGGAAGAAEGEAGKDKEKEAAPSAAPKKKVVIKLPQETVLGEDGKTVVSKADFARVPLPLVFYKHPKVPSVEMTTADEFKLDVWVGKTQLPPSIDIYLPGKVRFCLRFFFWIVYFHIFVY
jgi:hypothetical protein